MTTPKPLNTLKHGLTAEAFDVLPHEDGAAFTRRLDAWLLDIAPETQAEGEMVLLAVSLSWKFDRARRCENEVLTRRIRDAVESCESEDPRDWASAAEIASFDPSNEGERLRRHQSTLLRELRQTLDTIAKLKRRAGGRPAPNEANSRRRPQDFERAIDDIPRPGLGERVRAAGVRGPSTDPIGSKTPHPAPPPPPRVSGEGRLTQARHEPEVEGAILRNEANSEDVRQECRTHKIARTNPIRANEANFDPPILRNEPNSQEPCGFSFTLEKESSLEPVRRPDPIPSRRRPKNPPTSQWNKRSQSAGSHPQGRGKSSPQRP